MSPIVVLARLRCAWWGVVLVVLVTVFAPRAWGESGGPAPRKTPASSRRAEREQGVRHTVQPGESLWTVARRHAVEVEALARVNRIRAGQRLRIGQQLAIPPAMAADSQEPPSPAEIVLGPPPEANGVAFAWPLGAAVASPFGPRGRSWHGGIDIRADRGTAVRAAAPGMVIASGWEGGYGRVIKIWHHLDFMTVYAHNHENVVHAGEWVERGQVIATVGSTGRTTAPHLHFEIRYAGRKYDPLFWLSRPGSVAVASTTPRTGREP